MKVVAKDGGGFKSFAIEVTFETADEAAAFYSLFNHNDLIRESVGMTAANLITDSIEKGNGGKCPNYQPFHNRLCDVVR